MAQTTEQQQPQQQGYGLSALLTTGFVSSVLAFCASLTYFHYFPQVQDKPAPIAVVDMVKLGMAVTQMSTEGDQSVFMNSGRAIAMLQEAGYIVLDNRLVIAAPDQYIRKPSDLIPGAPDYDSVEGGYAPPVIVEDTGDGKAR